jgi:hypothetical protein
MTEKSCTSCNLLKKVYQFCDSQRTETAKKLDVLPDDAYSRTGTRICQQIENFADSRCYGLKTAYFSEDQHAAIPGFFDLLFVSRSKIFS